MVDIETCRKLALGFPNAVEQEHFGIPSFRVNKKIFMTLRPKENLAMIKLPEFAQSVYAASDPASIYPVKGFWGTKGATMFDLTKVKKSIFHAALKEAYESVVNKK